MQRHIYGTCGDEDCPACASVIEQADLRDAREDYSERELARMADGAGADMVYGRSPW